VLKERRRGERGSDGFLIVGGRQQQKGRGGEKQPRRGAIRRNSFWDLRNEESLRDDGAFTGT